MWITGISCNKRIVGNIPPDHSGIFGTTILKGAQDEKESSDTIVYSRCCRYACGGGGFFGIMFLQKHLDKREYEKTDTKLESIMDVIAKAMTLTLLLLICL